MTKEIKMDNAALDAAFVLSFAKEKEFIDATENDFFQHKNPKDRRAMLKEVYQIAQKMKATEAKTQK